MAVLPDQPIAVAPTQAFRQSVLSGLQSTPKRLSSMYFYDAAGDALFQRIMAMPEYYLTRCEYEVFEQHRAAMLDAFGHDGFDIVELGAGDGTKTKVLLQHFLAEGADIRYFPVDISGAVLRTLADDLAVRWPDLPVDTLCGDYFDMLGQMPTNSPRPRVILFLGANIGNYESNEAQQFLKLLRTRMRPQDRLLVGFDLKKDPQRILNAYNDPAGITSAFNLNILHRMNRELGADFDAAQFRHWENYDPVSGDTRSFIVSEKAQTVTFPGDVVVHFEAWEAIRVELSKKYSLSDIRHLGKEAGLCEAGFFTDSRNEFVDFLWTSTDTVH